MKRILVTGAGGFIGRTCLDPLSRAGWEVHAVGRTSHSDAAPGVRWHVCDLLSEQGAGLLLSRLQPDALLHLAWDVTPGQYVSSPSNLDWLAASCRLLRQFAACGGRRAIGVGTCFEYDLNAVGDAPVPEDAPKRPNTLYGQAKHALSETLFAAAKPLELEVVWARPFWMYGPGEAPGRLVSDLLSGLREGRPVSCRHGQLVREMSFVGDLGRWLAALVDSGVTGPVNLAAGQALSLGQIARALADIVGRPELLTVQSEPAPGQPLVVRADPSRLASAIGPLDPTPLSVGLGQVVA